MPSKIIRNKANYLLHVYVGDGSGIIGWIKTKYWINRIKYMSEGEILKRYYDLESGAMINE